MQADAHLYSDGKFPPVPEFALANLNLNYHVPPAPEVDGTSDNVAVLRFEAERDTDNPSKVVARAGLRNYRGAPATVRPRLELKDAAGRVQARYDADEVRGKNAPVTVPAKAEKPDLTFTLSDIPEDADLTLELVLDGHTDAFAADDRAWVVLGVVRKAKVLVVGPGNAILRYVLDAASMKRVAEVTYHQPEVLLPTADPKDYLTPARDGRFDLVIFDRCARRPGAVAAVEHLFHWHPAAAVQAGRRGQGRRPADGESRHRAERPRLAGPAPDHPQPVRAR